MVSCHIQNSPQAMPLATSILKSCVQSNENIDIQLMDFYINTDYEDAVKQILNQEPDSVGFSMYIWNRHFIEQAARKIRNANENILIYAGGAEITAAAEEISKNSDFNYLVRGEGEIPFLKLMTQFQNKDGEESERILQKEHFQDLNLIPSPFLSGNLDPANWDGVLWELSRGCPFNCAFCSESRGIGGVRYFNDDRIISELKLFEKKEVEQIFVLDPTFNINRDRALNLISLIKEHAPYIHYTFEIRAELLDERLAEEFAELHCSLQIGLQSSDTEVLKQLNRTIDKEKFSEKIALLNKYGAVFGLDLIYGLPGDTKEGFMNSLDYALYQIPNHLDIFRLSIFPGTELYDRSDELRLNFKTTAPYNIISTPDYNESELENSEGIAAAVDIFYNQGRSAGWFLSVSEILEFSPSVFFERFALFLNNTSIDKSNIFELQNQYLLKIFNEEKKEKYLGVAIDLSLFHFLYSEALHGEYNQPLDMENIQYSADDVYKKSSNLKQGIFSYDVTLYSEQGMIEIESFTSNYSPEVSYGLIYNNGYEILTMAIEQYLYQFIIALDGKKTINDILDLINKEADEIQDFIDFLIESALITPVG